MNLKRLASLEWKSFKRQGNLTQTILMGLGKAYFGGFYFIIAVAMSFAIFGIDKTVDAKENLFKYAIYFWVADLVVRYFFQKMPTAHIKPLLVQNIRKKTIVSYGLLKSSLSFFNFVNISMGIAVLYALMRYEEPDSPLLNIAFAFSYMMLLLASCYLVQLLNHVNKIAIPFLVVFASLVGLDYFGYFEITNYTQPVFSFIYHQFWMVFLIAVYLFVLFNACYRFYFGNLSLESAIVEKKDQYKYYDLNFLNRFGSLAPFLKLDLKLLTRNKRTRTVLLISLLFLLYGLLFFANPIDAFGGSFFVVISGLMVTGGFMLMFGQYVPSWDSSYYPLMMTQNIPYRRYLESKWLIMVIGTAVSMILGSFYIFFGWEVYLTIVAVGFYNIGWNCYLALITGAFVRSKIDLTTNKNAFGDKKSFNIQTLLISLPVILIPIILYAILSFFLEFNYAMIAYIIIGLIGILVKKPMFDLIEKLYKRQKYTTLKAYK